MKLLINYHKMKSINLKVAMLLLSAFLWSSSHSQTVADTSTKGILTVNDFEKKSKESNIQIIDVRTSEEFKSGYLKGAKNIDYYAKDFEKQIQTLPKSKTYLLYCLGGTRSGKAMEMMKQNGFQNVYSLKGGIMKWRIEDKPIIETVAIKTSKGMTPDEFNLRVKSDKMIVVEIYGPWCPPCKKMNLILDSVSNEMKDKIEILRLNFDNNKDLAKYLNVENFPTLYLYKDGQHLWHGDGVMEKERLLKLINRY